MMDQNTFDELARRKLAERSFPFAQEDWHAMEQLLDARPKRAPWWPALAVILLVCGGAVAYFGLTGEDAAPPGTGIGDQAATSRPFREAPLEDSTMASTIHVAGTEDPKAARAVVTRAPIAETASTTHLHGNTDARPAHATPETPHTGRERAGSGQASDTDRSLPLGEAPFRSPAAPAKPTTEIPDPPRVSTTEPTGTLTWTQDQLMVKTSLDLDNDHAAIAEPARPDSLEPMTEAHTQPFVEPTIPDTVDLVIGGEGAADSTASATAAGEPTAVAAPNAARTTLELGLWAGLQATHTTYGGEATRDWGHSMQASRSYSAGLELLRMGRNFGFGAGLHVSDYSERIRTNAVDRSRTELDPYYFMRPVDTALLLITDTVFVGGVAQYTGQTVYTTVFVLDQAVDTVTVTERLREARDQVNRTLYVEIPLLVDAHLVQGRWNLGVRGGPTAALLNRRRGLLPDAGETGYTDLASRDMNTLVLGYTARAYVRYRFSAGWSVGLEPMLRGHLTNGMADDALTRRPRAWGLAFGLNYRFR
jgi:hypothetical protein